MFDEFKNLRTGAQASLPITLIRPSLVFSAKSYSTPLTPPIGCAYLAAVLEKAGYVVNLIDCAGLAIDKIRTTGDGRFKVQGLDVDASIAMIDPDSDIIAVTIMFSQEWPFVKKYLTEIRHKFPNAKIVVGGEHVTAMTDFCLKDCPVIDFAVRGEGELPLLHLVYNIRLGDTCHDISGVSYVKDGKIYESNVSPRLRNIDALPWPAWHLIGLEAYFRPNFTMGIAQGRNMPILATRGCPYRCTFCSSSVMWTTNYVTRPVEDVVDEIEYYIEKYKVNSIDFYDLTAIVKKEWVVCFTEELLKRELSITWQLPSGTRSEAIDEEVISGLAATGLKFLVYAPESGSKRVLKQIKKKVNLKRLIESVSIAKKYGLIVKVNFMLGFPDEKREDVFKTLLMMWFFALKNVDDCNLASFSPYPGSELFEDLRREGKIPRIDDAYFESLMTQFDFTMAKTFCKNISSLELLVYRTFGMAIFYIISYIRSPGRLLRIFKIVFLKQSEGFKPGSLFEQRVYDFVVRRKEVN